ncbi:MAG: HAD-IIIA family hydrolase [Gammaproteobacteria bacterium]|nr:HAD-IIIA family hydrolase [Gammaproteobacteria bacterium]
MDSVARIVASLRAAITDLGWEPRTTPALRDVIGLGLREAAQKLYPQIETAGYQRFVERYRHHFMVADPTPSELFPGAADTLRELQREGYLLAVATGKGRQGLNKVLDETGLASLFHSTRCADETTSKPHPHMLLEIMHELAVPPEATLMIGDTEYDMEMANNAGTPALAVDYGVHDRTRLARHAPLHCISEIRELIAWLEQV